MIEHLLTFMGGVTLGMLIRLKYRPPRPVIHIRGKSPGVFRNLLCEKCLNGEGQRRFAEYLDQDTRSWCGQHLPRTTRYAERAAQEGDGAFCFAHGMDCPKPWSLV